jgi:ubiquinone biosynthesis protein UbiJ
LRKKDTQGAGTQQTEVVVPTEEDIQKYLVAVNGVSRVDLLEGFADLVGERMGYWMGRRLQGQEMSDKCKTELTAVRDKSKSLREHVAELISEEKPEVRDAIKAEQKELTGLRKTASEATKPFRTKISELTKAVKYCDTVTIPDSLKELGKAVAPRFSLSEWVSKALEAAKNKKKKQ